VIVTFYLLPAKDVGDMAEALLVAFQQPGLEMSMRMGEGLPEPVANLVIFAIERVPNGVALGIGWPYDFTNKLEVFARSAVATTGWFVASSNLSTTGTNSLWWKMSYSSGLRKGAGRAGIRPAVRAERGHVLNHRQRRVLGGRTPCAALEAGRRLVRMEYNRRKREEVFKEIRGLAADITRLGDDRDRVAELAFRYAAETWMQQKALFTCPSPRRCRLIMPFSKLINGDVAQSNIIQRLAKAWLASV
jgi:hypothetical protein